MYTRLQNELEKILTPHNISNETSIFNDTIFKLAGIEIKKSDKNQQAIGFYDNSYYSNQSDTELPFNVPAISMEYDMPKLLIYLNQAKETYLMGKPLYISEEIIKKLLKDFNEYITYTMKNFNSNSNNELKPYLLKSKAILEEKALKKIQEAARNLIKTTHTVCTGKLNGGQTILIAYLDQLLFIIQKLSEKPDTYTLIGEYQEYFEEFFDRHPEFTQDILFSKDINLLKEGFKNYNNFNRVETVLAVGKFFKELSEFTEDHGISTAYCDVFEEFLMKMADIHNKPKSCVFKSGKDIGADPTRIIFTIEGINTEDSKKFIDFFKAAGDESAKEWSPQRMCNESMMLESYNPNKPKVPKKSVEKHSFEIDGWVLYKTILPQFKEKIIQCIQNSSKQLQKYRDLCVIKATIEKIDELDDKLSSAKNADTKILVKPILNQLSSLRTLLSNYNTYDKDNFIHELMKVSLDLCSTIDIIKFDSTPETYQLLSNFPLLLSQSVNKMKGEIYIACEDQMQLVESKPVTEIPSITISIPGTMFTPVSNNLNTNYADNTTNDIFSLKS